ncbi:unnamed protein product, partial [Darwinula stevensoni]
VCVGLCVGLVTKEARRRVKEAEEVKEPEPGEEPVDDWKLKKKSHSVRSRVVVCVCSAFRRGTEIEVGKPTRIVLEFSCRVSLSRRLDMMSTANPSPKIGKPKTNRKFYHPTQDEDEDLLTRWQPQDLKALGLRTKFTERELKKLYRGFKNECPSGILKEDRFRQIYAQFFPASARTRKYAELIFKTLDVAGTGIVTFEDFAVTFSFLTRGTLEEKLRWIYKLYDQNHDGKITEEDIHEVAVAVSNLLGGSTTVPHSIQRRVQELWTVCSIFVAQLQLVAFECR